MKVGFHSIGGQLISIVLHTCSFGCVEIFIIFILENLMELVETLASLLQLSLRLKKLLKLVEAVILLLQFSLLSRKVSLGSRESVSEARSAYIIACILVVVAKLNRNNDSLHDSSCCCEAGADPSNHRPRILSHG